MTAIRKLIGRVALLVLLAALALLGANAYVSYHNTRALYDAAGWVGHTHDVMHEVSGLRTAMLDAETGQRGFLLTGKPAFLGPHHNAGPRTTAHLDRIAELTADNQSQQQRLPALRTKIAARLNILQANIKVPPPKDARPQGVVSDPRVKGEGGKDPPPKSSGSPVDPEELERGRLEMNEVRAILNEMDDEERRLLTARADTARDNYRRANLTFLVATLLASVVLVGGYALVRRNLTVRQQSEDAAHESERFVRLVLDSTGDGICGTDRDGRCTFANAAALRILGLKRDELVGRDLYALAHASPTDGSTKSESPVRRAVANGTVVRVENEAFRRAGGGVVPVDLSAAPLRSGRWVEGAVVTFADATQRARAEAATAEQLLLATLAAEVGEAVVQSSELADMLRRCAETLVRTLGAAFARVWTLNAADQVLELRASAGLYTHLDGPHARVPVGRFKIGLIAQERRPHLTNDVPNDPRVGDREWARREGMVAFAGYPLVVGGAVVGVIALFARQPLSPAATRAMGAAAAAVAMGIERKRAEADLRAAVDAAEAASVAKGTFLANMSHELRTPLNAVIMYSELLQEEAEDRGVTDFLPDLEKIRTAGRHLLGLVNSILDLSKIEAGKMDLYLERFEVGDVIRDVTATVQPLLKKRDNALVVAAASDLGPMTADLTKVRQVLFNLLSNASKFTEKGTVTLAVRRRDAERPGVEFRVSDTGIGMTPEQVGRLFQPFTQADASTTRKFGGTGLGLTIVKQFCEMMGGGVRLQSEPGRGTTFTVWLPAEVVTAAEPVGEAGAAAGPPNGPDVLVIDDEATARELLTRVLSREGFRVRAAADGKTGLALAALDRPDVVLLDVTMPSMDGWAVLAAFKADSRLSDVPVVMHTMLDDKTMGFALGAAEYLTKPVERERLVGVLNKFAGRQASGPVLVVEDDDDTRQAVRRAVEAEGWRVAEAQNGVVALARAAEALPAAILLDLMMPEMDGFEFLSELRERPGGGDVPVVVLTAKELTAEDRARLNGHVERVLQKGTSGHEAMLKEVRRVVAAHARRPDRMPGDSATAGGTTAANPAATQTEVTDAAHPDR